MSEFEELYKPADRFVKINDLDPDRKTIVLSLPSPPPIDKIDGYGLHPDEQYFRRKQTPPKIVAMEREVLRELQDRKKGNYQETITGYKVLEMFWERFENSDDMENEIDYIKSMWWYRTYGYWFFNDGQPVWITGRHFMFLNFFFMADVKENEGYPEYRDRHRREFIFREYLRYAHHTFAKRDEKGWAIPEDDGHYEMIDMRMRLFYGDIHPKSRRNGSTMMSLSDMIEDTERKRGVYSTIISKDGESTEEHYNTKLIPAWADRPVYIRPIWNGTFMPSTIRYYPPKNNTGLDTLLSILDYTVSAGETKKDGSKFSGFVCFDEEGKNENSNSLARWDVTKNNMATGDGSKIAGYCSHISTVEDINASGKAFLDMLDQSDFYQRNNNGQTLSGLADMGFPSYDGLEGFVDKFGMSVIQSPTQRQVDLRPDAQFAILNMGAYQYQKEKRDDYLKKGTPSAMQSYRAYVKKYPWRKGELTMGTNADMGWDYEVLDKRLAELRRLSSLGKLQTKIGNLYRRGDSAEGVVYWRTEDNGKFEITYEPPAELTNLKRKTMGWDAGKGGYVPQWEPVYKSKFTLGADPVEYSNKKDDHDGSRQSDPAMTIHRSFDPLIDKSGDPTEWETEDCILYYRYRPQSIYEYCEDVLMAAEWMGAMIYPERNKTKIIEHVVQRGRAGYLKHDIDPLNGKTAAEPGYYVSTNKSEGFGLVKDWIALHGHKCKISRLLEEIRNIGSSDQLTKFDGLASWIAALRGSQSPQGKIMDNFNNVRVDFSKSGWLNG